MCQQTVAFQSTRALPKCKNVPHNFDIPLAHFPYQTEQSHLFTMKLFISIALLLVSKQLAAFTPAGSRKNSVLLKKPSSSTTDLRFIDDRSDVDQNLLDDLSLLMDPANRALAASLGVTDDMIQEEYNQWLMIYDKVADESRYPIFKRNWLLQEDYNRRVEIDFALNEFADRTEGKQMIVFES